MPTQPKRAYRYEEREQDVVAQLAGSWQWFSRMHERGRLHCGDRHRGKDALAARPRQQLQSARPNRSNG